MSEAVKIAEGKTKIIYTDPSDQNTVIIENKDTITAGNGAREARIPCKDRMATETTSNVFRLLGRQGIRNHFIEEMPPNRFRATKLDMMPLEIVARSVAYGSFLKRNPAVKPEVDLGFVAVEFFAKDDQKGDPLLHFNYKDKVITFFDPNKPQGHDSVLHTEPMESSRFNISQQDRTELIDTAKTVFGVLETAWEDEGFKLVDLKIECGRDPSGTIMVGDVIDNDSWRLWRHGDSSQMVDKQLFRNNRPLEEVAAAYAVVAAFSENL